MSACYVPVKPDRSAFVPVRHLQYHVREWGAPDAPLLVMLHGWMDVAASFQFVVDALRRDWHVVAPDWRGFGLTLSPMQDSYWVPDYLADLDVLLRHYSPDAPADVVGHSMGGNVLTLYAGARPGRVRRVVNLEGMGLAGQPASEAPQRLGQWLDQLARPPTLRTYGSEAEVAARLRANDPLLPEDRANWLAQHWSVRQADGRYALRADAAHKIVNPYLYRVGETVAVWGAVTAPVLWVIGDQSGHLEKLQAVPGYTERLQAIRQRREVVVEGAGHMLHHDQPERVAELIEEFFAG